MKLDDLNSESRVLSAAMCEAGVALDLAGRLCPDDFASTLYAILWAEVSRRAAAGALLDAHGIARDLVTSGVIPQDSEEIAWQALLPDRLTSASVVDDAVCRLLDLSRRRRLRTVGRAVAELAEDGELSAADLEARALQRIVELATTSGPKRDTSIAAAVRQAMDEIRLASEGKEPGIPLPWPGMQAKTLGLFRRELVVVAARPGVGKTAFGAQVAEHAAVCGRHAQFRSLEMGAAELAKRYLSSRSRVSHRTLRSGQIHGADEWDRLTTAASRTSALTIEIDDESPVTIADIQVSARRAHALGVCDLVIVDYLQKVNGSNRYGRNGNRDQEVTEVAEGLKDIAKSLDIPVVALAQLNRNVEKRGVAEREPILSDLRESGGIEQAADAIWFLHRDVTNEQDDTAKVFVKKSRNGELGTVLLRYRADLVRFEDPAPEWREEERYQ